METPFVLNFAPTGMVPRRADSPWVPLDPAAIAEEVDQAAEQGITLAHLHARDTAGAPTHDPEVYADIISRIRRLRPGLVLCVSLSGRDRPDFASRSAPLSLTGDVKPDMASLTLASLNFSGGPSVNGPGMVRDLAGAMLAAGVAPELEVFDTGMINYAAYLAGRGWIQPPFYFNLILGNPATAQADPLTLGALLAPMPAGSLWAAGGLGRHQTRAAALALASGGGVRIGLEDNLFLDQKRTIPAMNLQLIRRVHTLAEALERPVMTPEEFRVRMNLLPGHGQYGRPPSPPPSPSSAP